MKIVSRFKKNGITNVCVEESPKKRTISFYGKKIHRIFPYVIFNVQYFNNFFSKNFFNLKVALANEPFEHGTRLVFPVTLGGVFFQNVCMPYFPRKYYLESSLIKNAIDVFWNSRFTNSPPYQLNEITQEKWIELTNKSQVPKMNLTYSFIMKDWDR